VIGAATFWLASCLKANVKEDDMSVRVTCIKKSGGYHENPHEAISTLGWKNEATNETGSSTREDMWKFVNDGGYAFVRDSAGNTAKVMAKTNSRGTKYVQTEADGKPSDNLLKLPEC
jgi:hypothetical protein